MMNLRVKRLYEFGPFRLDTIDRVLFWRDKAICLTSKAYEILLMLVQYGGHVVEKDQLMNKAWPDTFVGESNLTQQIFVLRRILSADEGKEYIETVPRRGYRFIPSVRELDEEQHEGNGNGNGRVENTARVEEALTLAEAAHAEAAHASLAVLPLEICTDNANTEYLTDGITESIISNLSQLPQARVLAWSAVARYKGRKVDLLEIGRELHVRTILTGKVFQINDRLVIRIELVDVETGFQIWGEQYNHKISDVLMVQEDISWEVSERLRLKLSEEDKGRIAKRPTENTEAYQLYLKGRYCWNKRTLESFTKAIEFIKQALEEDPGYALAYSALADCYSLYSCHNVVSPKEGFLKAKAAALKALSLDPNLAEAHASMALVRLLYDWDWVSAEKEFKRALVLNANYGMGHHWYSTFLARLGRFDEAVAEIKLAQSLDPLSLIITNSLGFIYYMKRDHDRALEYARKVLELDPNFSASHGLIGMVYYQMEMYPEALKYMQQGVNLSKRDPEAVSFLAMIYGKMGYKDKVYEILEDFNELAEERYISPMQFCMVNIALQKWKRAFDYIKQACDHRSHVVSYLKVLPFLDPLRTDPQYDELLRSVGLLQ